MRPIRFVVLAVLCLSSLGIQAQATTAKAAHKPMRSTRGDEAAIRAVLNHWAEAFRARNVDGIMSVYAPGDAVVAYDIVPPLEYRGNDAYRKDYEQFLAMFDGPLGLEFREMRIVAGHDVAFMNSLEHMTGNMKGGQKMDTWVRATSGFQKIDGKWKIVHDHISVPTEFDAGKAVLDLKP